MRLSNYFRKDLHFTNDKTVNSILNTIHRAIVRRYKGYQLHRVAAAHMTENPGLPDYGIAYKLSLPKHVTDCEWGYLNLVGEVVRHIHRAHIR